MTAKERPILFSGAMVRAILEGRKTQTRRVVNPQPANGVRWLTGWEDGHGRAFRCPYGNAGDQLWVRETFCVGYEYESGEFTALPFDGCEKTRKAFYRATDDDAPNEPIRPWKPSIHMPRWASRITLEIVSVRVERLQDIGENDALSEGVETAMPVSGGVVLPSSDMLRTNGSGVVMPSAKAEFADLWDSINAKRGFGWNVNPWVWAIEFKRVTP